MTSTLYFASGNKNKLEEISKIIPESFILKSLADLGFTGDIPETADTLEGNALLKAQFVSDKYRVNCFADDTGLEIEALDGRPGVFSARYAGPGCSADDNINKVLAELDGMENRKARFRTVIASIIDGKINYSEGVVNGKITMDRMGDKGFGYDPIFIPDGFEISFAQMSMDEKNEISHRGRALRSFVAYLNE